MCASPNAALALSALALVGLLACHSDPVSPSSREGTAPATLGLGGSAVLVVDDNGADCPRANFTSIQAAVAEAEPGSTILVCAGVYEEQVLIDKNELRLLATGKPGTVVLDGEDDPAMIAGFLLNTAEGNLIEGFVVQNYHEAGILLVESSRNTIRKNVTTGSPHHDGIQVADSPENVVEHNRSFANTSAIACGINVIGTLSTGNIVRHNETFENQFGVQVAFGAANNVIIHNESHDNRALGIRNIVASNGTLIENNRVLNNVQRGISVTGGSNGVLVARNKAFNNDAADLFWDETGAVEFENNHCRFSVPAGLCEHTEGASQK